MAVLKINKVKCTKELKASGCGSVYVEEIDLWAFRITPEDDWIYIPQSVLSTSGSECLVNVYEVVGRLFRFGHRVEAEMLLKQIKRFEEQ